MKLNLLMIAGMLVAGAAFADGPTLPDQANDKATAAQANRDAHPTATAPTLPDQASDKAVNALTNVAFGKKGAEMRAAHAAENQAADRAAEARAAAAARAAAGATRVVPTPTSHPGR